MDNYDKNINPFEKLEPDFLKSEKELWDKIEQETSNKTKIKKINLSWVKYVAAASVVLLISITLFMRFYTQTINTSKGEHLTQTLPDGSGIELNAETSVTYNPYWWRFKRELNFSGEAFFEVAKGKRFTVVSEQGTTTVLGTSFNVYARNAEYNVYCKTGKVKVASTKFDVKFKITKGELAVIDNQNKAGQKSVANENELLAWTQNKFNFTDAPLNKVFQEIERQYDIEIELQNNIDTLKFGGYFDIPDKPEQVIGLICVQFNLKLEKINSKTYKIDRK
ncbi:MAG: FecR domain-containing protein [Bacteroidota bacterium]|nr:FecR domain-containing protein [Bacteroidota bacterium]